MATVLTTELWQKVLALHGQIAGEITAVTRTQLLQLLTDHAITEPRHFFHFVYVVENFDPNALSVAAYAQRDPFDHSSVTQAHFDNWLALGLVDGGENGRYRITPLGNLLRQKRWELLIGDLQQHPLNDATSLHNILAQFGRVKTAVCQAAPPPERHNFQMRTQQGLRPPQPIYPLLQFIEYRMDFGADRDDCHLAAWDEKASDLPPLARELMTIMQNGEAYKIDNIQQQVARRGFGDDGWKTAVSHLNKNKWLTTQQNTAQLTTAGVQLRKTVEQTTNKHFYQPWQQALTTTEISKLANNLATLQNKLKPN